MSTTVPPVKCFSCEKELGIGERCVVEPIKHRESCRTDMFTSRNTCIDCFKKRVNVLEILAFERINE